jgi:hypothetical protein
MLAAPRLRRAARPPRPNCTRVWPLPAAGPFFLSSHRAVLAWERSVMETRFPRTAGTQCSTSFAHASSGSSSTERRGSGSVKPSQPPAGDLATRPAASPKIMSASAPRDTVTMGRANAFESTCGGSASPSSYTFTTCTRGGAGVSGGLRGAAPLGRITEVLPSRRCVLQRLLAVALCNVAECFRAGCAPPCWASARAAGCPPRPASAPAPPAPRASPPPARARPPAPPPALLRLQQAWRQEHSS